MFSHARACVCVLYLPDVILWVEGKQFPSNVEGDDGQRGNLLTVNDVLEGRQGRLDGAERCVSITGQQLC